MTNSNRCLSESICSNIAGNRVSDAERHAYEHHLDACESCCEQLETKSAQPHIWQSISEFLRDDQLDQEWSGGGRRDESDVSKDVAELLQFLTPTDDPHMLGRLGSYEVAGIIGAGGMGIVIKAFEPALARFVAIKIPAPRYWSDQLARDRFTREARAAASIVHENVIEIYGVNEAQGIPYFAMPYLRGETLEARIQRQGRLEMEEILRVSMQVAAGLAAAHAQGLVHRDIKPANILLGSGAERVRITDFGIAFLGADPRMTQSGQIAGTPQYMSPEQVRGETVDGRSDLFSLGSLMYAMSTGVAPFQADSPYQLLQEVVSADPTPLEEIDSAIPDWLAAIVAKLHSPLPEDRYQSADELATELQQCLASCHQPVAVSRPRSVTRLEAKYRRARRLKSFKTHQLFLGGLVLMLCSLVIVGLALPFPDPDPDPVVADSVDVRGQVLDEDGKPVSGVALLAVRKTWPNNRYRQEMLKTTTDQDGKFAFEKFAAQGKQYAFLLSVISDKHLMTSEYRVVKEGSQQDPIVLRTEKSPPVTIQFQDSKGKPLQNVRALPRRRMRKDGTEYLNYSQQVFSAGVPVDKKGQVQFGSWKPGEKGVLAYLINGQANSTAITIPESRSVTVEVSPIELKPAGQPVHVAGQVVDSDGKPLAKVKVLVIQKTWPNRRYRQDALSAMTDTQGKFRLEKFAKTGSQYAFLLTVVADGYAMVSDYQVVRDGSQKPPITLKVEPAQPANFLIKQADGKPAEGVKISPGKRHVDQQTTYLQYASHADDTAKQTNARGEVSFTCWKAGESGSIYYQHENQRGELKFKVADNRQVILALP